MPDRSKSLLPLSVVLLVIGFATFSRFAGGVRTVEAVGLSGAGFSVGVGFALLAFGIARRRAG